MAALSSSIVEPVIPARSAGPAEELNAAEQQLAWLVTKATRADKDSYRYLLLLRFAVVNLVAFGLLGAAYVHGFVGDIVASDQTRLVVVIFGVFVIGLAICARKVVQTSREMNQVRNFDPMVRSRAQVYLAQIRGRNGESRTMAASALKLKLSHRIGIVRNFANSLVLLGLIGTVIGFIIALSGVDPKNVADVSAVSPMVANLIEGISVALYTTLVGSVLNIWLMANYHMLASGTVNLITAIVEFGESRCART